MKITIILEDGQANLTQSNVYLSVERAKQFAGYVIEHFTKVSKNEIGFHLETVPDGMKIAAIKHIRQYMEIGLKEAKDLVESNFPFIKPLKSDQLYEAARDFEKFGCKIKMHNQEEYQNWSATFDVINS